jgi:hypothetical protein
MPVHLPGLDDETARALARLQDELQAEAREVVRSLGVRELLERAGSVVEHGSSVSGLMAWPDIDFGVTSPGLTPARAFDIMQPLLTHPHTTMVRYTNEVGERSFSGTPPDERLFFMVYVQHTTDRVWKIDIPFWLYPESRGDEQFTEQLRARLTPETRLAILWLKSLWHSSPLYPTAVGSMDIYTAVLDHGVRDPAAFDAYLVARDKPTLAEASEVRRKARDL